MKARALALAVLVAAPRVGTSQEPYPVRREFNQPARMPDGVVLMADVYRPDVRSKVPAILVRTPYMRTSLGSYQDGHYWASRGYAYVVQDVRGRGESGGKFEPLVDEAKDGYATQSWVARQPWSNGKVGTMGGSYLGWTQVFPAPLNNPALKAMIPMVTPSDPGRYWPTRYGGVVLGMIEWLMVVDGRTRRGLPEDEAEIFPAYKTLPLTEIDQSLGIRSAVWRRYLANLHNADYWVSRSYQHLLPRSTVPMFHVTGWYDGTLSGSLENFRAMRTKASAEARKNQYLMVGPWRHWVDSDAETGTIGDMSFGPAAKVDTKQQYRRWLDRWLQGDTAATAAWPRVRVFAMGDNHWIAADDWPIPGTRFVPYYAAGGRAGDPDAGRLTVAAPADTAPGRYAYDPGDATPFLWTKNVDSGGPDDYRPVESRRDVLVYTMATPREKMLICGPIRATVKASTSAKDTDWVARLTLVRPDGYSQRLNEGWVSARARRGSFRNDPVTPGTVESYDIDLWGTCVTVRPGERLRLAIMSAAFPLIARNLNTGEPIGTGTRMVVARQSIYPGTLVTLPIVDNPNEIDPPN